MLPIIQPLVDQGFAIHWLHSKSKRPVGKDWSTQPVAALKQLRATFREGMNVGVRLGEPSRVGDHYLHVIDLDIRKDESEEQAYEMLRRLFPEFESYPCVISGSGGASRHFYILTEQPYRSKKLAHSIESFRDEAGHKHWFWEIELFGTGKQVAMPPSIHPDTELPYRWLREFDFDEMVIDGGPVVAADDMPVDLDLDLASDLDDEDDDIAGLVELVNQPPLGLTVDEIQQMLEALPQDEWCEDRAGWIRVGMALHHETGGSDQGFDLFCDFSRGSSKFDLKDTRYQWERLGRRGEKFTMGGLKRVLRDEGLDFAQCLKRLGQATKYKPALLMVAQYELSPSEIDTIIPMLQTLAKAVGLTGNKASVQKDLKIAMRDAQMLSATRRRKSIEDWLADEVLRIYYAGGKHLMRFGKAFWVYDKGFWQVPDADRLGKHVFTVVNQAMNMSEDGNEALLVALTESGRTEAMNSLTNAIEGLLAKKCALEDADDPMGLCSLSPPSVMNCRNGELWFKDGDYSWHEHDHEGMFTSQLGCEYDPLAECAEWDQAIARIFRDNPDAEDIIRHLYEVGGYMIQQQRDFAAWVMFYGSGSNGKSFVTQIIQAVLGHRSWAAKSLGELASSRNNHMEAGLVGKLMLIDDDFKAKALLPDDVLKKFSETKTMTANPKGAAEFNFVCRTVPLICSNHMPKTSDLSYGLERRALVFHFNSRIEEAEKDATLFRRIVDNELSGILNHFIDGWCRLQERGRFEEPKSCHEVKRTWLGKRNAISQFAGDCLVVTGEAKDRVLCQDVWEVFQRWCIQDNSGSKYGRNSFYDELASIPGVRKDRITEGHAFFGLKLADALDGTEHFDELDIEDLI